MRALLLLIIVSISYCTTTAQQNSQFGKIHPEAPKQLLDYQELIGLHQCLSTKRDQQGNFPDTVSFIWSFKYIFNGIAVQDETWKEDGSYTSSIRQFDTDSVSWLVTYFTSQGISFPAPHWTGEPRKDNKIQLYRPQKAPNGFDGYSRLTFQNITDDSFQWKGDWVSVDESFERTFWQITCNKMLDD